MSLLWTSLVLLSLHCGQLCCAFHSVQMHTVWADFGEPAVLPCNGSAYGEKEGSVLWEMMGEDVALLRGEEPKQGDKFLGRVRLPSEEQLREGDWSVVLQSTKVSDANMYECIWQGRETISTVWLKINMPIQRSLVRYAGDSVHLMCYIGSPDNFPDDYGDVWWTRNSSTSVEIVSNEDTSHFFNWLAVPEGISHLVIFSMETSDSGEYSCLHKTRDWTEPRHGQPERTILTVLEPHPTDITGMTEAQTTVTTEETVTLLQDEGMTEAQTTVTTEEMVTLLQDEAPLPSVPPTYQGVPETSPESFHWDAVQWDTFPWIRIGLISGVLLVTAVVLCVLKALQKI